MTIGQKNIVDMGSGDKKGSQTPPKDKPKSAPTATQERDLKSRIAMCFERIAAAAEARGDTELAEVIREDTAVMATGLVSLTRPFRALRAPLLVILAVIEPVMAFSRLGRLFVERLLEGRAERAAAKQTEAPTA